MGIIADEIHKILPWDAVTIRSEYYDLVDELEEKLVNILKKRGIPTYEEISNILAKYRYKNPRVMALRRRMRQKLDYIKAYSPKKRGT